MRSVKYAAMRAVHVATMKMGMERTWATDEV
jgi:hypothetical protein